MTGSHKVVGSIPISSTKDFKGLGGRKSVAAFLLWALFIKLFTFLFEKFFGYRVLHFPPLIIVEVRVMLGHGCVCVSHGLL